MCRTVDPCAANKVRWMLGIAEVRPSSVVRTAIATSQKLTLLFATSSGKMRGGNLVFGGRPRPVDRARKLSKALLLRYPCLHL